MSVGVLVEPEGAVRAWARTVPAITTLAPGGVFLELPTNPTYPLLLVRGVIGGQVAPSQPPLLEPVVQFDAYGGTRQQAAQLAYAVVQAVESITGQVRMGDDLIALSGAVTRLPQLATDPGSGRPRYSLDARFLLRSAH